MILIAKDNTPEPGVYYNVPFAEYVGWNAMNNSRLKAAARSGKHLQAALDQGEIESTDAMRLGTLMHAGTLEPMSLMARYVVMPAFENEVRKPDGSEYASPKASSAYKQLVADFTTANRDKEIVTQDQYDKMLGMVQSINSDTLAKSLLSVPGKSEVSVVADCPETGIRCKVRFDWLPDDPSYFVDLKSTVCAEYRAFSHAIVKYGYDHGMSMYRKVLEWATGEVRTPYLIAVENTTPFAVQAAPLGDRTIKRGEDMFRRGLFMLRDGLNSGRWQGYDPVEAWDVPEYLLPDDESIPVKIS